MPILKQKKHVIAHYATNRRTPARDTVDRWIERSGAKTKRGYDTNKIDAFLASINSPYGRRGEDKKESATEDSENTQKSESQLRKEKLEREVRKLDLQNLEVEIRIKKELGELISLAEQEERESKMTAAIRTNLLSLPRANSDILAHLEPEELQEKLTDLIRSALASLADGIDANSG